jgi:choline-sulfatase
MKRRDFVKTTAAASIAAAGGISAQGKEARRPNIVYIFTDQQSATMMSCTGNKWLKTPAMDYLAANGVRFERAYTSNPVCVPARTSFMTGWLPDTHGIRANSSTLRFKSVENYAETNIGAQLKRAGYALAYGGKIHLPRELYPDKLGFNVISKGRKMDLSKDAATFIKRDHDKPYYLVLSYINPHDICYYHRTDLKPMAGNLALQKIAESDPDFFKGGKCPPLPPNFEPQPDEPEAYQAMKSITLKNRTALTEEDWRLGRWLYCRLTESVDAEIQVVLDAIKESGQEENTVVIFSSDHGENDATYRLHGKRTFNEESIRIPFIVMDKGGAQKAGQVDKKHLVSNGLDLLPTVLDYAGVPGAKGDPRGLSVRPLVEGREIPWREDIGVESSFGRMVMNDRFKYIEYDMDGNIEVRLRDRQNDPHEKTHCTANPGQATDLARMRDVSKRWFPKKGSLMRNKNKKRKRRKKD